MIRKLMQIDVHVIPEPGGTWAVEQYNAFEGLWRDWRRFGLNVAQVHNFCCILFDITPCSSEDTPDD